MTIFEALVAIGFACIVFIIAVISTALSAQISKLRDDIRINRKNEKQNKTIYVLSYYCGFDKSWVLDNAYENKSDAEKRAISFSDEGYSIKEIELFKSNK